MNRRHQARIIFITGTDTGVGKTVLTGLLLAHLRRRSHVLAMKPFCSGGTEDVDLLDALQDNELSTREVNPFYFPEPVAPLVAARRHRCRIHLRDAVEKVHALARRCDCLLVEGSGGLLVPLGEGFSVLELIGALRCEVIVVARNRLGTLNHTLLTIRALRAAGVQRLKVVLMETQRRRDFSCASNKRTLGELLAATPLFCVPFLGKGCSTASGVERCALAMKRTLRQIADTSVSG